MINALKLIFSSAVVIMTITACSGGDSSVATSSLDSSAPTSSWVGTKQLGAANQLTFGYAVATHSSRQVYVTGST